MVSRNTREVKEFFERVAGDWDNMRLAYYDERVIERIAEVSGVGEASEVADVGTGTGFVAAGIAPRVRRVIGIDNALAMLEVARKNLRVLGASTWISWPVKCHDCPWKTARWTPRSPTWSCTTPRTLRRCCGRWPGS